MRDAFLLQEVLEDYRAKQQRESVAGRFTMADHFMARADALERAVDMARKAAARAEAAE